MFFVGAPKAHIMPLTGAMRYMRVMKRSYRYPPLPDAQPQRKVWGAREYGLLAAQQLNPQKGVAHKVQRGQVSHAPAAREGSKDAHDEPEVMILRQPGHPISGLTLRPALIIKRLEDDRSVRQRSTV